MCIQTTAARVSRQCNNVVVLPTDVYTNNSCTCQSVTQQCCCVTDWCVYKQQLHVSVGNATMLLCYRLMPTPVVYSGQVKRTVLLGQGWSWSQLGPARIQITDDGKYCFVRRTVELFNELPAEALETFLWKSQTLCVRIEGVCRVVTKRRELEGTENGKLHVVTFFEVQWSEMKWTSLVIINLWLCSCTYVLCSALGLYYLLLFFIC